MPIVEKPLARTLATRSVIAAIGLGLVAALLQIGLDYRSESSRFDVTLQRLLKAAAAPARQAAYTLDQSGAEQVLSGLLAYDFIVESRILDETGQLLAELKKADKPQLGRLFGETVEYREALTFSADSDADSGEMIILIDRSVVLASFVDRALVILSFGLVRNLILALVLIWLYGRYLARPISLFTKALASIDVTDPASTAISELKDHERDELGLLSATIRRFLRSSGEHLKKLRETERTLSQSELRFRNLAESSIQGIIIHRHGKIIFANQAHADILGYDSPRDLMALESFSVFVSPEDRERLLSYAKRRFKGLKPPSSYEFRAVRPDGSLVWLENRVKLVDWEGGPAIQSLTVDITERKAAEQALRESEQRLRTLVEAAPLPINIKTPDGLITLANRRFEELYKLLPGAAIGREMRSLLSEEQATRSRSTDQEVIDTGSVVQFEAALELADGDRSDNIVTKFPVLGDDGCVTSIGTFIVDVTTLKRAEEELRQSQKMQTIGQLTGGVAHDFNNILAVVIGNLERLADTLKGHPRELELVERATSAGERGAHLTQQLLAFSRKQVLAPKPLDTGQLVAGMIDLLRRSLGETIEIETSSDASLWLCEVDSVQMENAILNLAINARDAMPRGGKLTIKSANLYFEEAAGAGEHGIPPGQYVVVTVSDTGSGMAAEISAKIFEPFFTTKAAVAGTGLGLSMVYGFVKQSNGHITVNSEVDEGTVFRIFLPRSSAKAVPPPTPSLSGVPRGRAERLLVVEDDDDLRELTLTQLHMLGYRITGAPNGAEALALFKARSEFDLVLTDLVLPGGMNGRELADRLLDLHPDLRVLFMSGYADSRLLGHGSQSSTVELLQKPFRKGELARRIRAVLDRAS